MNKVKAAASIMAIVMFAGILSGCSKTTKIPTDRFIKACEKMGLEEFDPDDGSPEPDELEDGIYFDADEDNIGKILREFSLDEVIDTDDVKSMAVAARFNGADELEDLTDIEDLADVKAEGAFAVQMELSENYTDDVMDYVDDWLDSLDIRKRNLTDKEYYSSKNEGYLKLHIDIADAAKIISDDDDFMDLAEEAFGEGFEDVLEDISGDIAVTIEINGSNLFLLAGGSMNTKASVYNDFVKAIGVSSDPMNIPTNKNVVKDLIGSPENLLNNIPVNPGSYLPDDGNNVMFSENQVGISLPTKDLMRWNSDGERMRSELESDGYKVDLQYATNDINTQKVQIQSMIDSGCKVLIIASIDSISLKDELAMAKENGIVVIAYDRMIMESEDVDYYVSFDNFLVGVLQAEYIVNTYGIDNTKTTYNMEITAGDPDDQNAKMFYNGAYSVLEPYIDSGRINIVSGQTGFIDVATPGWSTDRARGRAENIIGTYYPMGSIIDAWLCSNDSTALGVTDALAAVYRGPYPVVTGQDCDIANVKNIISGKQAMSVFKDTRTLASQAVKMTEQILEGQDVDVNDTSTYNNGAKIIPAYLCDPIFVDANNYRNVLIDSGYYTEADLD